MSAGSLSAMDTGANIVVGGLVVQLLFFGFFMIVSAIFHWRVKSRSGYADLSHFSDSHHGRSKMTWETVMWALYVACLLILVRSVFRVLEFIEGNDGFIMRKEYLLYIFDALLMTLAGLVLWGCHPGSVLARDERKRESELSLRPSGIDMTSACVH
jgi:hypothetical protein